MSKWNPFSRTYIVTCPDGTTRIIYKNIEKAFPLHIEGWEADFKGKLKTEMLGNAEVDSKYTSKVDALLIGLDDINNGVMMSFRSAYVGFESNPCENDEYFRKLIEKIHDEQRRLKALKMQLTGFVELIKSTKNIDSTIVLEKYYSLACRIGSSDIDKEIAPVAINEATEAAKIMMEP